MTPEEIEREAEHEDWCAERYAFLLNGHPYDLPSPFACGWCGETVGTNGVQSKRGGVSEEISCNCRLYNDKGGSISEWRCWQHRLLPGEGTIHIDFAGTPWHYLCILKRGASSPEVQP